MLKKIGKKVVVTTGLCLKCFVDKCKFATAKVNKGMFVQQCKDFVSLQDKSEDDMKGNKVTI